MNKKLFKFERFCLTWGVYAQLCYHKQPKVHKIKKKINSGSNCKYSSDHQLVCVCECVWVGLSCLSIIMYVFVSSSREIIT